MQDLGSIEIARCYTLEVPEVLARYLATWKAPEWMVFQGSTVAWWFLQSLELSRLIWHFANKALQGSSRRHVVAHF